MKKDRRIDTYIEKSADFAKPILIHLRKLVHTACPDVEEVMKWGMPFFDYKGPFCNMAAFKEHAVFGFWKQSLMKDPHKMLDREAMGSLGRITKLSDLPADNILLSYLEEAMKINEEGLKVMNKKPGGKKALDVPSYFMNELKKNKKARETFENFSYTNKKEYVEWITTAKTDETRDERMKTAVEWMAEGKIRHWKYMKK